MPATWTTRYEVSSRSPDCQSRSGPHVYVDAFAAMSSVPVGRCRLAGASMSKGIVINDQKFAEIIVISDQKFAEITAWQGRA